jgi:PAS domain S-box-containing protein
MAAKKTPSRSKAQWREERDGLIQLSLDMLGVVGFDGRFRQLNPAWNKTLGWPEQELLAKFWLDLVHPADRGAALGAAASLAHNGKALSFEHRWQCQDGSYRAVRCHAVPDPEKQTILVVARDLSDGQPEAAFRPEPEVSRPMVIEDAAAGYATGGAPPASARRSPTPRRKPPADPDADLREKARSRMEGLRRGDKLHDEEWEIIRPDGDKRVLHFSPSLLTTSDGITHVLAFIQDITERQRQAQELFLEKEKYRTLVEESPLGVAIIDRQGRFSYLSPKFIDLFGYTLESLPTRDKWFAKIFPNPAYRAEVMAAWASALSGKPEAEASPCTFTAVCKSKALKIIRFRPATLSSGDQLVICEDISQRTRAEAAFGILVNHAPIGIFIIQNGRFKMVNPGFQEITQYSAAEIIGQPPLEIIIPELRKMVHTQDSRRLTGESLGPYEYQFINKNGEARWVMETVTPTLYEGEPALLGYLMDITELKLLEGQYSRAQKMEAMGRLAGGIAHDFNNMLAVIIWYCNIFLKSLHPESTLKSGVEEIIKAVNRAIALTRQLMTFSSKQVMQPQVIDLNQVVRDIEKLLRRLGGEDVDLRIILDPDLDNVKADPSQLEQVIMNLAINARDAMPDGGKLTVETGNVYLDENYFFQHPYTIPGNYVRLTVSDNGMGMDKDTQAQIFEPFFTTKEPGKGTGLGLATVYGILKQSGGYIEVYSELGQGTTFKVYLPRVEEEVEAPKPLPEFAEPGRGTETILLVEDEETLRRLVCAALREHGYQVLEARHGAQAMLRCENYRGPIHLLLTDVILPKLSGRELADRLTPKHPGLQVLYMSGYTENTIIHHGVMDSEMNFIQKPFSPEELLRKVRDLLDQPSP